MIPSILVESIRDQRTDSEDSSDVGPINKNANTSNFSSHNVTDNGMNNLHVDSDDDFKEPMNANTKVKCTTNICAVPLTTTKPVEDDLVHLLNAKYEDKGDHVIVCTDETSVIIPKQFRFTLSTSHWDDYIEHRITRKGNVVRGFRRGWLDLLRSQLLEHNLCCVFNFKRQHANKGREGIIYKGYGYCAHKEDCWTCVQVTGLKHPVEDKIVFTVRQDDTVATEIAAKFAPAFRRRCGNFSDVPTGDILRHIRSEVLKEHDLHQDPIIDLRERMKIYTSVHRYLHHATIQSTFNCILTSIYLLELYIWVHLLQPLVRCKEGKQKLSRYAKKAMDVLQGRCVRFEADLFAYMRSKQMVVPRKSTSSTWLQGFPFISWGTFAEDNADFVFVNTFSAIKSKRLASTQL
ncbi:unnamed protein product [Allacma fusca]|nr:unnamed protein product [Allacma fusca]